MGSAECGEFWNAKSLKGRGAQQPALLADVDGRDRLGLNMIRHGVTSSNRNQCTWSDIDSTEVGFIGHHGFYALFSFPFRFNVPCRDYGSKDIFCGNIYKRSRGVRGFGFFCVRRRQKGFADTESYMQCLVETGASIVSDRRDGITRESNVPASRFIPS
jgi:hypothetical protein